MTRNHQKHLTSAPGRALVAAGLALLASLIVVSGAAATEHHPKGGFAVFADCPLSNPSTVLCTVANTTSGEFTIGKRTVPITKTITLQGGLKPIGETEEDELIAAENGETLVKTPETVPGGLLDIVAPEFLPKWLQEIFNNFINEGFTGVTETTELAKPASNVKVNLDNLIGEHGTALSLPVKVKLNNVFLGSECYIGSSSSPVQLNLTTGETSPPSPNKPIKGAAGKLTFEEGFQIVILNGGSLVENAWAAPGAHGCGGFFLEGLIDPAVNAELGLPSAAGNNTAILNGKLETAKAESVLASE
jgi:hypothetical protein